MSDVLRAIALAALLASAATGAIGIGVTRSIKTEAYLLVLCVALLAGGLTALFVASQI